MASKVTDPNIPLNTAPEFQGTGESPDDFLDDDESNTDVETGETEEFEDETNPDLPLDLSKLSQDQKKALLEQLQQETAEPAKGKSGISDSDAVDADEAHGDRAIAMKNYLSKCRRVTFLIPRKENEPMNVVETVIMNGWRFNIKKGEFVDLPVPVAEILKASYAHTMNDNQPYLVANIGTKIDEVTGQPKDPSQLL